MPTSLDDILGRLTPDKRQTVDELTARFEREEIEHRAARHDVFEIFEDETGEFRFRLVTANGQILARSEGYATRELALAAIEALKTVAPDAEIIPSAA